MKNILLTACVIISGIASAQTATTQKLDDKYEGLSLYFYRNTLRMLNQSDNKEFDELIKDIEKMRFLLIDKTKSNFDKNEYKKLQAGYLSEQYEEMMTGRYEGRNFNIYLKEKNGEVKGTIILASDSSNLMVLDILGKVALNKAQDLFKAIDENTDISSKVKSFMGEDKVEEKKKRTSTSDN